MPSKAREPEPEAAEVACDGCHKPIPGRTTRPVRYRVFCDSCRDAGMPTVVRQREWRAAHAAGVETLHGWPAPGWAVVLINTGTDRVRLSVRVGSAKRPADVIAALERCRGAISEKIGAVRAAEPTQ